MPVFLAVEERWGGSLEGRTDTPVEVSAATNSLTGEELVRSYVYQVHKDAEYAARRDKTKREAALTPEERKLNAELKQGRDRTPQQALASDWKQTAEIALEAFRQGQLLVFVDQDQIMPEAPTVVVPAMATVRFVQILPLVGG